MGEGAKVDSFGLHMHECTHIFTQAYTCANQIENKTTTTKSVLRASVSS